VPLPGEETSAYTNPLFQMQARDGALGFGDLPPDPTMQQIGAEMAQHVAGTATDPDEVGSFSTAERGEPSALSAVTLASSTPFAVERGAMEIPMRPEPVAPPGGPDAPSQSLLDFASGDSTSGLNLSRGDGRRMECPSCHKQTSKEKQKCQYCSKPLRKTDSVEASAADQAMALWLSEKHHKLKCPKCDTVNSAKSDSCSSCGHDLKEARKAKFANLAQAEHNASVMSIDLSETVDQDTGLVWKVLCKTGTLALSPGPGQIDIEKPLQLTPELFLSVKQAFDERAYEDVLIPRRHEDVEDVMSNTGTVELLDILTKGEAIADTRLSNKGKQKIKDDPDETLYMLGGMNFTDRKVKEKVEEGSILNCSVGLKFNVRPNKLSGKLYPVALEHVALTQQPWVYGLPAFGARDAIPLSQNEELVRTPWDGVFDVAPDVDLAFGRGAKTFDPDKHPRDRLGKFVKAISGAKKVELPDGTSVTKTDTGMGWQVKGSDGKTSFAASPGEAAKTALSRSKYDNATDEEKTKARKKNKHDRFLAQNPALDKPSLSLVQLAQKIGLDPALLNRDIPKQEDGDILSEEEVTALLASVSAAAPLESAEAGTETETMSDKSNKSLEQILAEQQARAEAAEERAAAAEQRAGALETTVLSQGQTLHTEGVRKEIQDLQRDGVPPEVAVRFQEIALADYGNNADGALNLSQTGEDGEQKTIKLSATDIARYIVAGVPRQRVPQDVSAVGADIQQLNASQQKGKSASEKADEIEKELHPDRFEADGSRKKDVA
jgi:hypothetical protein